MPDEPRMLAHELIRAVEQLADDIDVTSIRSEWAPYAPTEVERTVWLEAAITRIVPERNRPNASA